MTSETHLLHEICHRVLLEMLPRTIGIGQYIACEGFLIACDRFVSEPASVLMLMRRMMLMQMMLLLLVLHSMNLLVLVSLLM